ncbi:MAG: DUF1572 family protein [Gemmatimonadetes bacterium]|nr:DUF1572 family protein [Gemmatimonadota bacterium]
MTVADDFLQASRRFLVDEYPRKIQRAVVGMSEVDLWWRPNDVSNSVGNLLLHLAGNVRQWVVHGLGGRPDVRRRAEEFARNGGLSAAEALTVLRRATDDADAVLAGLDPARLEEDLEIQGLAVRGLDALYHVVEHFSMHTGQILYLAKMRSGTDLGFYVVDEEGKVVDTRW